MNPLDSISATYLDVEALRAEFPILSRMVHGSVPLVYLDNAATAQKPQAVINAITEYYGHSNANVHRGGHTLGTESTSLFESARSVVAQFINAAPEEVIFTKGATEGINLVASSLATKEGSTLAGRSVVITEMEHHANIVPWQMFCQRTGAHLRVIGVCDDGTLDQEQISLYIDEKTYLVAVVHLSNTLGITNDVKAICKRAASFGALTLVDGAQSVVHHAIDVRSIGCDYFVFSGHKLYAPTGIGVLYGKLDVLEAMPPYQGGGSMILDVSFDGTTYNEVPLRFEAGTPNIEGAIGLGTAIRWFSALNRVALAHHEATIAADLMHGLREIDGLRILGSGTKHVGIASFVIGGVHANDVGMLLDEQGVAVRVGHHCTMPLMRRFGVDATARVSIAAYTNQADIANFFSALHKVLRILR